MEELKISDIHKDPKNNNQLVVKTKDPYEGVLSKEECEPKEFTFELGEMVEKNGKNLPLTLSLVASSLILWKVLVEDENSKKGKLKYTPIQRREL